MFLFRCVFWLSLVYASILLKPDGLNLPGLVQSDLAAVSKTGGALAKAGRVLHSCAMRHGLCQTQAATLTGLIDKLDQAQRDQ